MINQIRLLCALLLSLAGLPTAVAQTESTAFDWLSEYSDFERNRYALEMPLTKENFDTLKNHLNRYQYLLLYLSAQDFSSNTTPKLRIGLFPSYNDARDFHRATEFLYNQQHIVLVSASEHQRIIDELKPQIVNAADGPIDSQRLLIFPIDPKQSRGLPQRQKSMLGLAKALYLDKAYAAAAQYYLLLAILVDEATAAWATELAGLCYEKMGRRDLAITQYKEVLKQFPQSSGTSRVNQRLRGLETAAANDPAALTSVSGNSTSDFFTRGVFGQYYRSVNRSINGDDSEDVLRLLSTDWDVRSSLRWHAHDINLRASGYWLKDELDGDNELAMKRLLVDYRHQTTGIGAVLGRQKDSDSGVFTSFDGLTVSYPIKENLRVALSTGEPVYTSDAYDSLDYFFYSLHSQWDIDDRWQLGSYIVSQEVNSVTDREAIGLRGRYSDERLTGSLYIDYDTAFSELNNLLLNVHYRISDHTDITALYGSQRSPFLTATNILIGQANLDLDAYLQVKENRNSLLDDAFSRTALNDYYSLSLSTRLNKNLRWTVDFYDSNLTDVPSSEFLLGLPDTGVSPDSFHYQSFGTQLIAENFLLQNDSATVGFRHATGDTSDSDQMFVYERMRLGSSWTVMPKLMISRINFTTSDDTQQQLRYSLSLTYRPWRNFEFNLEAGNESISSDQTKIDFDSQYIFLGYRFNF